MEITTSEQSAASRAFELRRKVRDGMLTSQASEHNYFKEIEEQVESTATHLCDFFSKLIQNEMLAWPETTLGLFAKSANIPLVVLNDWRSSFVIMNDAATMLAESEKLVKHLKSEKSKFSATFWGAKKGMAEQYAAADIPLSYAESSHKVTLKNSQLAGVTAMKCAGIVLEKCISHAVEIAQCPVFGTDIKAFLEKATQTASQTQLRHSHEQSQLIEEVQSSLAALKIIYRSE